MANPREILERINQAKIDKKYKKPKSKKWIVVDPKTGKEHSFSDSTNAQNYIKVQTKKMNEPKNPTAKELEAQSIEKIRKGEGTLTDSLTAKIVPKDVLQAKIDAKPKKEPSLKEKIKEIEDLQDILEDGEDEKFDKLEQMRIALLKQTDIYKSLNDSTSTDNYNAPEPKKKISRRERTKIFQAKVKAIQEKIESGELGKIPKKYLMNGNRAGYMWAKDLAKIEMETPADPLGLRK